MLGLALIFDPTLSFIAHGDYLMRTLVSSLVAVALLASTMFFAPTVADDDKDAKVDFKNVKCVVNPKAGAKETNAADYKGGKVYTCCGGCLAKFKKNPESFATAANQQLVVSKQFKQAKCPISGGKVNASKTVKVNGTEVGFCCGNCQGKVAGAEGKEQAELVFGEKAFKKGFVAVKK